MTGASREDKASIREEFTVTMKLNIQKWNAASVFLGCCWTLSSGECMYAFRKATGSTRWWWASASASNVLIRICFHIIHPMAVLHNNIHKDRCRKPNVGPWGSHGGTDKLHTRTFISNGKGRSSHRQIFSLCALCVTRSQVQICFWNVNSFTTRGGMLLTENDDNAILDGLDLCLWDEPRL